MSDVLALTNRERSVVLAVKQGLSNKNIGKQLGITEDTVKVYMRSIFRKLGLTSRLQVAIWDDGTLRGDAEASLHANLCHPTFAPKGLPMSRPLYQAIASKVSARINCDQTNKVEWSYRHATEVDRLVKEYLPSGSGFDAGTKLDWDKSTGDKLVFNTSFHHMDDAGGYDGWTEHTVTVVGSLMFGLLLKIGGRDRDGIKDHVHEAFHNSLTMTYEEPKSAEVAHG